MLRLKRCDFRNGSRRYCHFRCLVRSPRHWKSTEARLPVAFLRSICKQRAQPSQPVPDRYTQDKSRTLRPVEWTRSAAISARWRSVHFWTERCAFAQPIGSLRQHAACVRNGSFWRRAEARRVHGPLGERRARPPQARPGSRCARPAPPAGGLDRPATARLFCFQAVMALRDRKPSTPESWRTAGPSSDRTQPRAYTFRASRTGERPAL
jgi:hypothetical protein